MRAEFPAPIQPFWRLSMTRMPLPRFATLLSALTALAGCSMDKPGQSAPATSPRPIGDKIATFKIAGMGFQNDQFFKIAEFGMKDAASKNGVELSLANSGG